MNNKRYLVTTAIESTWPDSTPLLFLGEWCKIYSRKEKWEKMDIDIVPYHWDNNNRIFDDYKYLLQLHEQLLEEIATELNAIHKVSHSTRYWRILIGPWIGYFVQILFDRWTSIKQAIANNEIAGTTVLTGNSDETVPQNMQHFINLLVTDEWNHNIYSWIIVNYTNIKVITQPAERSEKNHLHTAKFSAWLSIKHNIKKIILAVPRKIYHWMARIFVRRTDALLFATYIPLSKEIRYQLSIGQFPYIPISEVSPTISFSSDKRNWTLKGKSLSEFESCVRHFIAKQIPVIYLEGYNTLIDNVKKLPWPQTPKYIWTSNAHMGNDIFKAWTAQKTEAGSRLVIGQHGGHYGIGKWLFLEDHDTAISDIFLSWGWTDKFRPKIKPLGQLKFRKPLGIDHAKNSVALMVTNNMPRYSYLMFASAISKQYIDELENQLLFVSALPETIRKSLVVRLYSSDFGWDQQKRWHDREPGILVDTTSQMDDLISKSRLYISTYNATTFLESFTMNVPTIIFWNMDRWQIRDSAIPYFNELKRVGIFHESPESAAGHVSKIWNNVSAWWESEEVKTVVKLFCERYSYMPRNIQKSLQKVLSEVAN